METKINIAAILKDKPEGTKLWTDMFGSVTLYVVTDACDAFQVKHHNKEPWFDKEGKLCKEGVLCICPSKSMRDWSKFSWKKGDVLISNDGKKEVFFNGFTDDTYALFKAKHGFEVLSNGNTIYLANEEGIATGDYTLEDKDAAQTYINTIEERFGGKLNRDTLEIEKSEFKDGDIVTIMPHIGDKLIYLFKAEDDEKYYGHAFLDGNIAIVNDDSYCQKDFCTARPSTDEEKSLLFNGLAKKNKAWDAEKKMIVDLKPKVELKPFDKVLGRNEKDDVWEAELFSHYREESQYPFRCIGFSRKYCIPYNEETAHLLGTTDEWKGGEG